MKGYKFKRACAVIFVSMGVAQSKSRVHMQEVPMKWSVICFLSAMHLSCAGSITRPSVVVNRLNGAVTCILPPEDILLTGLDAKISAAIPGIDSTLRAGVSFEKKFERVRSEVPNLQAIEVLEFRMCVAYGSGIIGRSEYDFFLKQILPKLLHLTGQSREEQLDECGDELACFNRGLDEHNSGRLEVAIRFYREAIEKSSKAGSLSRINIASVYFNLGIAYYNSAIESKFRLAVGAYLESIEKIKSKNLSEPSRARVQLSLGYAYWKAGDRTEAIKTLRSICPQWPNSYECDDAKNQLRWMDQ